VRKVIITLAVASLAAGIGVTFAGGRPSAPAANPTRVFDRTVACKTRVGAVRVLAQTGAARTPGQGGFIDVNGDPSGIGLQTGYGLPFALAVADDQDPDVYRGVRVDTKNCTRTANRVPLTSKGLPAPVAFTAKVICVTGAKALVRLRYRYVPGAHDPGLQVGGRMLSAEVAVRSYTTLKPVAFAKLGAEGTSLEFSYASGCRTSK
jgi:hypothetical protein